jgi:two-component system chemotaxis response regulator CheY
MEYAGSSPDTERAGATTMKTILAVDDSGSLRQMLSFSLKAAGYGVIEAVDGQDGLDKAKQQQVDMVLTDQNMPGMDGLSLIKALRAMKNYQNVPILMLTTESGDDMKAMGRAAGANGWLVKPFDPARLTEVVKKLIG